MRTSPAAIRKLRSMVPMLAFMTISRSVSAPVLQRSEQQHASQHGRHEYDDLPAPGEQDRHGGPRTDTGYSPTDAKDRKSGVEGTSVAVRVDHGGSRIIKK